MFTITKVKSLSNQSINDSKNGIVKELIIKEDNYNGIKWLTGC